MSQSQPQTIFRAPYSGSSTSKQGICSHCDKVLEDGETPRICSGCQEYPYCSSLCQREAWKKYHQAACPFTHHAHTMIRANRRAHSQPSLPTTEERYQLLRDFIETHHLSFQRAARFAVLHHRKDGIFDYDNMCMVVHLQYRPDSDRNPGMAFRVERSNFCPLASLLQLPECRQFWEAITAGRTAYMESCGADKDGAGVLPILYITRDHLLFSFMRQSRPSLQDAAASPQAQRDACLQSFQFVQAGVVFRQMGQGTDGSAQWAPGRLEKTGAKWKWVPFFDSTNSDADDGADIPAVAAAGKTT